MQKSQLHEFLDVRGVKYNSMFHSPVFTAQEVAASAHVPGKEIAKTVMVKADGRVIMVVLPATKRIDFERLKDVIGAERLELAKEEEFKGLFPACETGAMPPFGNLYGVEVFVDELLTEDDEIAFNAETHSELIRISFNDFFRLVKPSIGEFAAAG